MKTLLINPFLTVSKDNSSQPTQLLSLPYLASFLISRGYEVDILDIAGLGCDRITELNDKIRYGISANEIKERINRYSPDLVGITCPSTAQAPDMHELAGLIKSLNPDIKTVVGGAHPSSSYESVLNDKNIDIVVRGEGEYTILEIAKNLSDNRPLNNIMGTIIRNNSRLQINPPREYIEQLDSIPFPARQLLPIELYLKQYSKQKNYLMRERALTILSSRGCPGNCIYCSVKTVWGRRWRYRSARNVVDEIEHLIRDFSAGEIHFLDDSISVDKRRLIEICEEITRRKLDIKWTAPNGIAIWLMDKMLLKKMKQAGCYRLTFGLESGNKETLNFIGKNYDYKQAKEIIKFASKIGLWTSGTFIIGFPYELINSINDTIDFAINSYLDFAIFFIANPYPGTEMYDIFLQEGLLSEDENLIVNGTDTKYFTQRELVTIQARAFSRFLKSRILKPWRLLSKLRNLEDGRYMIKLFRNSSDIIFNTKNVEENGIAALWRK